MKYGQAALLILGMLGLAGASLAQDRKPITLEEKRRMVVSARAGEVNLVEGEVSVKGAQDSSLLVAGDVVKEGDIVKTGAGGRAELLLSPGSYLRLSENTEFKFDNTSIDSLKINLIKGSAIVESAAAEGSGAVLATVTTPKAQFSIVGSGVYRFDVDSSGGAEARVTKGRLTTGTVEVREGKEAVVGDSGCEVEAFDKKSQDTFDAWSKDRAKSLVEANSDLTRTNVNLQPAGLYSPFGFGSPYSLSGLGWYSPCAGSWYFDPFFGSFIYLPNAFGGCSSFFSPYGYGYQAFYYPPTGRGYVAPGGGRLAGKHPRYQPGGPTATNLGARQGGQLGHHGAAGGPTIGHASPSYAASHSSVGHYGGVGSFGGSGSIGHASSGAASASSSMAAPSSSGHHH